MTWLFNGQPFDEALVIKYEGFVYRITNTVSGRRYIGKKFFSFNRKWKAKDKRRSKRESDWKDYYGSSDALKKDIEELGKDKFIREILVLCKTKGDTNTMEMSLLWQHQVLESNDWYNECIGNRRTTSEHIRNARIFCEELKNAGRT